MPLFYFLFYLFYVTLAEEDLGGWLTNSSDIVALEGPCNIEIHEAGELTQKEFLSRYAYSEPVIVRNFDNSKFRESCAKDRLINDWGDTMVQLSSANTYSYKKKKSSFSEYLEKYLRPQKPGQLGNETWYLFGDIDREEWAPLLNQYLRPPWVVPGHTGVLSFGIAGAGTGVPFHFHGPGFAEVIYGRKRWFMYPPDEKPDFDPDQTTLEWFLYKYPNLPRDQKPLECIMNPGEVIYFPDRWWHATLNAETSVFVSTFLSP